MGTRIFAFVLLTFSYCDLRAQTPFLSARGDGERCSAIDRWVTAMANAAPDLARKGQPLGSVAGKGFVDAIGKSYFKLSGGEKRSIANGLRKCRQEPWITTMLTRAFELKPPAADLLEWAAIFERGEGIIAPPASAQPSGVSAAEIRRLVEPPGGWRADPVFFSARDKKQRCAAIDVYLDSIRSVHARRWAGQNGDSDLNQVTSDILMTYAPYAFVGVFGKPFGSLSKDEKEKIADSLKSCSKEEWAKDGLIRPFVVDIEHPAMRSWKAAFSNARYTARAENDNILSRIPMNAVPAGTKRIEQGILFDATGGWSGVLGCEYKGLAGTYLGRWSVTLKVEQASGDAKPVEVSVRSLKESQRSGVYKGILRLNSLTGAIQLGFDGDHGYFANADTMLERGADPAEIFSRFAVSGAWMSMDGNAIKLGRDLINRCRTTELSLTRLGARPELVQPSPTLASELQEFVAYVHQIEHVDSLSSTWSAHIGRFSYLGEAQIHAARTELVRRLQPRMDANLAAHVQELRRLPQNAVGFGGTRQIYENLTNGSTGLNPEDTRIIQALSELKQIRHAIWRVASQSIRASIDKARTLQEMDNWRTGALLPGIDPGTEEGRQIEEAISIHRARLVRDYDLDFMSQRERDLMDSRDIVRVPTNYTQPTMGEIRLAILRTLASPLRIDTPTLVRIRLSPFPGISEIVEIHGISDVVCKGSQPDAGYECTYRITLSNWVRTAWTSNPTPDSFKQIANQMTSRTRETFRLTSEGWICPSLGRRILDRRAAGAQALLESLLPQ